MTYYIDSNSSNVGAFECDEISHNDGTFSYKKRSNGRVLSKTPDGVWEDRPENEIGVWEKFVKSNNSPVLIANRNWDGKFNSYLIPFSTTK